jgi:hypothetical protein
MSSEYSEVFYYPRPAYGPFELYYYNSIHCFGTLNIKIHEKCFRWFFVKHGSFGLHVDFVAFAFFIPQLPSSSSPLLSVAFCNVFSCVPFSS